MGERAGGGIEWGERSRRDRAGVWGQLSSSQSPLSFFFSFFFFEESL